MKIYLTTIALGLALLASPAIAQSASGGASGGGATQGGSASPGSGTGTPGATTTNQTDTGIGTSSTSKQPAMTAPTAGSGMATVPPAPPAQ